MGYKKEKIQEKFGHMLKAFTYGAPPHGGIALGLTEIYQFCKMNPNIREVIAFPKTGDGRDLMMDAPSEVDKKQLEELHIKIDIKNKAKEDEKNKKTKTKKAVKKL